MYIYEGKNEFERIPQKETKNKKKYIQMENEVL